MALVGCPECQKQVSDKAKACPECGYPVADDICTALEHEAEGAEAREICTDPESGECSSCGKALSSAVEKCNFCDEVNENFRHTDFNSFNKLSDVCRQCGQVVKGNASICCTKCRIGAPLIKEQTLLADNKENSEKISSMHSPRYILIALEIIAIIVCANFTYEILEHNGDRRYLYEQYGALYILIFALPFLGFAVSVLMSMLKKISYANNVIPTFIASAIMFEFAIDRYSVPRIMVLIGLSIAWFFVSRKVPIVNKEKPNEEKTKTCGNCKYKKYFLIPGDMCIKHAKRVAREHGCHDFAHV